MPNKNLELAKIRQLFVKCSGVKTTAIYVARILKYEFLQCVIGKLVCVNLGT